jgi:hypothetical protein
MIDELLQAAALATRRNKSARKQSACTTLDTSYSKADEQHIPPALIAG